MTDEELSRIRERVAAFPLDRWAESAPAFVDALYDRVLLLQEVDHVRDVAFECLFELPQLPCRVDEMTQCEYAIYQIAVAATGALQHIGNR